MNKYEQAARRLGWTCGGDDNDVIYNTNDYGCWKEAVSWSPDEGNVYDSWMDCCHQEGITIQPQDDWRIVAQPESDVS